MLQLQPLDPQMPIFRQLSSEDTPIVLVNLFYVAEADVPDLLIAWEQDGNWMKRQPGFLSTQLHQGIGGSTTFLNYAVWESVAHFRAAFNHPEFKSALEKYPSSVVASPLLFKRLSVPNLCVGP
jgi:heme-degrading monooxygenase HmoA